MNKFEVIELLKRFGSPLYVFDDKPFIDNYHQLCELFRKIYPNYNPGYSYKTNYTPRICQLVDQLGGYAEVVSDMEYEIARRIGISPSKVHFNGPYKNSAAVKEIILGGGIVNLDDYIEVPAILELAKSHPERQIQIGIRCNFKINDRTTSRFGFDVPKQAFQEMLQTLRAAGNISIAGIQCHFASRSLDTWQPRANGLCKLVDDVCDETPDHIDLGGGMYGKMKDSLKMQFNTRIPTYEEYAQKAAAFIADHFQNATKRPTLFIEPGSALVGDVMRFAAPVVSIKDIRGKAIATLLGSVYNINPTLNRKNPPITVYSDTPSVRTEYENLDFGGYTCIESDYLYKGYNGPLAVGDIVVFENVGSYSVVLKPPFILPNFPIIEWDNGHTSVVKRKESFDDLFHTYKFDF
jgi:diaminopimelate decarboxylase